MRSGMPLPWKSEIEIDMETCYWVYLDETTSRMKLELEQAEERLPLRRPAHWKISYAYFLCRREGHSLLGLILLLVDMLWHV